MTDQVELRQYFAVLRRWLWLVLLCTALAAGSAFLVSSRMTPVYAASTTLLVHQAPASGTSDYTAILTSERLARTYAEMLTARPVLEEVIAQLELEETPTDLANALTVELVRDTQLIRLNVEGTDPAGVAQIADAVANVFILQNQQLQEARYGDSLSNMQQQITELTGLIEETQAGIEGLGAPQSPDEQSDLARLETILAGYRNTSAMLLQNYEQMRLTATQSVDNVLIFEPAQVELTPVRPRTMMNTALAAVVGGMLAVGVAFLIEYLDDTIKTPTDVSQALGLGTLGAIGQLDRGAAELVTSVEPLSPISEAFRVLRTNIRFSGVDRPLKTLLVTSAQPYEGKSITVANLAVTMAQSGLRVVVLDGDLRRPRQHSLFHLRQREGLTQSLLEGATDGRLQPAEIDGLRILPAGEKPHNPAELLGSRRMQELLQELSDQADVVLIDSPPVLPITDAAVLAPSVDGVILVIEAGKTRREVARQAVESLQQVGANVVGAVLNAVPTRGRDRYRYYHYGSHYYTDGRDKPNRSRMRRLLPQRRRKGEERVEHQQ